MAYPYICTKCHFEFESDKDEGARCPQCSWSTSVVRKGKEVEEEIEKTLEPKPPETLKKGSLLKFSFTVIIILLLGATFIFLYPWIRSMNDDIAIPSLEKRDQEGVSEPHDTAGNLRRYLKQC